MKKNCKPCILFSEGSSLSAKQALSSLGTLGYEIAICDPDPFCICRFSRFTKKYYRSPAIGDNPLEYLEFIENILTKNRYDVLLAIHEQAFLFSKVAARLKKHVGLAISSFDSFKMLQSKISLMQLLDTLQISYPKTTLCRDEDTIKNYKRYPFYLKTEYGTASSGVWRITDEDNLFKTISTLKKNAQLNGQKQFLLQEVAPGNLEIAYACFNQGELISVHCCMRQMEGARGSSSIKIGVNRPSVIQDLKKIGNYLTWHGSLAFDYLFDAKNDKPYYIDASPRLVEPMNSTINNINIPEILVNLSMQKRYQPQIISSAGIKSHMLMMSLLGNAERGGTRRDLLREITKALLKKELYSNSTEELTDVFGDPLTLIPLFIVLTQLLVNPRSASRISSKAVKNYALTDESINTILKMP